MSCYSICSTIMTDRYTTGENLLKDLELSPLYGMLKVLGVAVALSLVILFKVPGNHDLSNLQK